MDREQRFGIFVAENRDRAVGLAWRLLGADAAAAEDVAQEAFVRAFRSLDRFREESSLSTWFYRILINEAQRHLRWRWVRQRFAADSIPKEHADPASEVTGDPILRGRIAKALNELSRFQREAFVLVHLSGFTVKEAAEVMKKPSGTVKSHLHRALVSLREQLGDLREPYGGTTA